MYWVVGLLALTACDRVFGFEDIRPDGPAIPIDARTGYAAAVLADHPVAYWRLGFASTLTAEDETDNGNIGTLIGGVTPGAPSPLVGDDDPAMELDGVDDMVTVGDRLSFEGIASFTIEAWVRPANHTTYVGVISKDDETMGGGINKGYHLFDDVAAFGLERSDGAIKQDVRTTGALPLNAWAHIAVTFDGLMLRLYVDGQQQAESVTAVAIPATTNAFTIGARNGGAYRWFSGAIDEVAVYDTDLEPTQIENHRRVALGQ